MDKHKYRRLAIIQTHADIVADCARMVSEYPENTDEFQHLRDMYLYLDFIAGLNPDDPECKDIIDSIWKRHGFEEDETNDEQ